MFMRYSGGGIGHQHESTRWESAAHGDEADQMDVDTELEEIGPHSQNNDLAQLHALAEIAAHLRENEDAGNETGSSHSLQSNSTDVSEELFDYGTDDDEEDRAYFGPEDNEPMFDYDEDEI